MPSSKRALLPALTPALASLLLFTAGCGDELPAPAYVGKINDPSSDAVVGLVSDGARVQLYLCGGPTSYATLTHWFQGPLAADGTFQIESGGFEASGDVGSGEGEVKTDDGQTLAFTLRPAKDETEGLYAAMDGSCRTGAVVADFDGDGAADLQGTWCDGKDRFAQVTPIRPMVLTTRGIFVEVQMEPQKELWVDRVRWP